jgi:hypothetical protein
LKAKIPRCDARVLRRDCYRVARGGNKRFRMSYTKGQCERAAVSGGRCRQHSDRAAFPVSLDWWKYIEK